MVGSQRSSAVGFGDVHANLIIDAEPGPISHQYIITGLYFPYLQILFSISNCYECY